MLALDKTVQDEITRGRPRTCDECHVALKPLLEDVCSDCGAGVVMLECPSCLDQDEYVMFYDRGDNYDARLVGRCHREQGRFITELELAALVRIYG